MAEKALLSCVAIIKNEAKSIEKVLSDAAPAVDRYDILDTGSMDGTQDLVRAVCERIGKPLSLREEPFIDFATSRNRSLELAAEHAVFGLQVSGDEYLHGPEALRAFCGDRKDLSGPGEGTYFVDIHYDDLFTDSQRLVRLDAGWRWVGAVHEYMTHPSDRTAHHVSGAFLLHTGSDGTRKRLRFYKDLELLREHHIQHPEDARTVFYLAQTLECLGMFGSASLTYAQRGRMGGWDEEAFVAKYRAAYFAQACNRPWSEVFDMYLEAWAARPWRAEPLVAIAEYYHGRERYAAAYLFASRAAALPYPKADTLFIDSNVYNWRALNLVGICAYYAGAYQEGMDATVRMIQLRPNDENLKKNLKFYADKLGLELQIVHAAAPAAVEPPPEAKVTVGEIELSLCQNSFDAWIFDEVVVDDAYRLRTTDLPARPVVVDLGAHVGIFAAAVLAQRPAARVCCYEMDPENFGRLRRLGNKIEAYQAAVIGMRVPTGYQHWPANTGANALSYDDATGLMPVPETITLGGIFGALDAERVDLLKIDVEGAEYEILRQASFDGVLARVDRIAGEWHEAFGGHHQELGEILAPLFELEFTRINGNSGMFFATRRAAA